jgi:HEAT repeat protein
MADVDIPPEAMKPRRVNPATILLGMVIVALGIGLVWFGLRQDEKKMTDLERIETQKNIFVLPEQEQIPHWRKWAGDKSADVTLRAEALTQLALLGDAEGAKIAIAALKDPNHGLRGTCAQVLAHYGPEGAPESAKPALLAALKDANETDRRQIIWALVELKEASIFHTAMESYKAGEITTVQRLEGGIAFDPLKITNLVSLDELAKKADDESAAVRQLVATILSENADPKWIDPLVKLVKDKEVVVAREAAPGLGRIADPRAREPLLQALKTADTDSREKFIKALRDGIGGAGLVLALDTVNKENEQKEWFQMKQLFDMLHTLADPRAGDAIVEWVEKNKPHTHWETEAGIALAEIGDVRGAKYIGKRMGIENSEIYQKEKFWQADAGGHLTKTDRPRVVGARMLADLAKIVPKDQIPQLKEYAEKPVIKWLTDKPQPHANGLRFLAAVGSEEGKDLIRDWAFPDEPLPVEGAQPPFPRAYETAQSALRYIGWMKDSRDKLLDQFDRKKDKKMDITQAGLEGAGLAMLGMALRAVTYGASNGLAEWGPQKDDRAEKKMMEFIEDKTWHEEARMAACGGLAWIAKEDTLAKVVERVGKYAASEDPKDQFIGSCYARTLTRRPIPSAVNMMVDLMRPELETGVRNALGHAIGVTSFEEGSDVEKKLFEMLDKPEMRVSVALALILGGSRSTAARTVATFADKDAKHSLNALKDLWFRAFGYWSDKDLDRGNIYRWVRNANAISRVKIGDAPQEWARQRLQAQFDNLVFDNGPHSETRVVLRYRLLQAAKNGEPDEKKGAMETLKFMKEQGSLLALRDMEGDTGAMAREAYHELMNPRLVAAEDLSHLQEDNE